MHDAGGATENPQPQGGGSAASTDDAIANIRRETDERIQKIRTEAERRIAQTLKQAVPLPQRKTIAHDFMEKARDRLRAILSQPLMSDADADNQLQQVLDAWFSAKQSTAAASA